MARRMIVVAACVLALTAAFPARASHPYGCGGNWSGSRGCSFEFRGFPLTITGEAFRDGRARVRVWVEVQNDPSDRIVVECQDTGRREATCDDAISLPENVDLLAREAVVMRCLVEGAGSGSYFCQSYASGD